MIALQFIAIFSCMIFTGAAIYINIAEHPARLECGTELAATVFVPSYNRASLMQASTSTYFNIFICHRLVSWGINIVVSGCSVYLLCCAIYIDSDYAHQY